MFKDDSFHNFANTTEKDGDGLLPSEIREAAPLSMNILRKQKGYNCDQDRISGPDLRL